MGLTFRLHLYAFVLMVSPLELFAQIDSALILPTEPVGTVELNISAFTNGNTENFTYEYLSVFVKDKGEKHRSIAIQGRHEIKGDYLVFSPYFPFEKGMTYVVKAKHLAADNGHSFHSFQLGKKSAIDEAKVVSIYPSGDQLPENLLRFYIYFNTPMKKGQALKYIQLTDTAGNIDRQAFMEFKQELWSPDGKRLTLLFDPGRIKRGVSTNRELGPALLESNRYHLSILDGWQDVYGQNLSEKKTKKFVVNYAYRQSIKTKEWAIDSPTANSYNPLRIHFDRMMDHALVQSMIQIEDDEKNLLEGHWEILQEEHLLQFIPTQIWQKGSYQIVFDNRLEDVAGNNLQSLLDQKESKKERPSNTHQTIAFKVKKP
ncbi:MAG: hypothetical protein AAFY45_30580 [Bacteroidota bacterium]